MRSLRFVFAFSFLLTALNTRAATYYSRASGTFNTAGTWSLNASGSPANGTPISNSDIFIIQSGHTVTVGASRTIARLTVNAGGTLAFNTYTLTISGDCLNNGTMQGTTGQITVNTGLFTNNGTFTYTSGRINRTTGDMINNGSITGTSGRITQTTGDLTNGATGTISYSATSVITFGTGNFINNNASSAVNFGSAAITISGTAASQSIGGFVTTGRLSCTKTSGTVTLTGDVTAGGLTMNGSGGTMNMGTSLTHDINNTVILTAGTLNGGSSTINVNFISTSAWGGSNAAVFNPGTGTVNLAAAGAQRTSASGTKTFYNLTVSNSGLKTLTAPVVVNNILSIEGSATVSAAPTYGSSAGLRYNTTTSRTAGVEWITPFDGTGGVSIGSTGTITANNAKTFSAGVPFTIENNAVFNAGANDVTFNGNFINNGTWTPNAGDVTVTGPDDQDIGSFTTSGTFFMTKSGGGIALMQGPFTVNNLTLNGSGGILRLGSGYEHVVSGTWTNTAGTLRCNTAKLNIDGNVSGTSITFASNNGTVRYRGASAQDIPPFTYNNIEFSNTGKKTLTGNTVCETALIESGSELALGSNTFEITGNGTPLVCNGTFTSETSTVLYSGANATQIAALEYYNLDGGAGDRTLSTTDTIGVKGTFTVGTGSYTVLNSIVRFSGDDGQVIPNFTFHGLVISNSGTKHIIASTTVACRSIEIEDDAMLEINADGGGKLNVID